MPMAQIEGGDIHYTLSGTGSPVVMLLPQSSGPLGPDAFVTTLAASFTVVRYDQRGTGRSAPARTAEDFTMVARAAEVDGLLDALDIARAHLCCHSTGCGVGVAFASRHPERVDRLVLLSPWTHADRHLTTMQQLRIAAARALDPCSYAIFNASLLFPPEYRRAHETGFAEIAAAAAAAPQNADLIARRLNAILAFDTRPLTPAIPCPTLIATAEDDQLMPAWFGREMAQSISGARFVGMESGGHMIPETRGSALAATIADFLAQAGSG